MLNFSCDYLEGCHQAILQRMAEENMRQHPGYGTDEITRSAERRIRLACALDNATVRLLVGGTQTNAVVLDALLRHNEGVLAAGTGHVNVHEAGAIEAGGHKVMPVESIHGKIDIGRLEEYLDTLAVELDAVGREHYVVPRVLYISQPTEMGTLYTLDELTRLRALCDKHHLLLYADGARLAYALASPECDVALPDLARLCHVFYFGGTKVGAMMGEAVVVCDPTLDVPRGLIKQHGALLAKGWILGVQFDTLFDGPLYMDLAANAVEQALRLREHLIDRGYEVYVPSYTNQQFVVMPNPSVEALAASVVFDRFAPIDSGHTLVRLCTSWATTPQQVDRLMDLL